MLASHTPITSRVVVFNEAGNVLVIRRGKGDHKEGYWDFPGGKMELKDRSKRHSKRVCGLRELEEETKIQATKRDLTRENQRKHPVKDKIFVLFSFQAKGCVKVDLEPEDKNTEPEHDQYKWVKPSQLPRKMNPSTVRLLSYKGSPFRLKR